MSDDIEIIERDTVYRGFFRIERFRLRHRLYRGGWSAPIEREVFERDLAVGVLLYDPAADALVLIEQFRLPPLVAGLPAWQTEIVAGIVDPRDGSEAEVARREAQEEAGIAIIGELVPIHRYMPSPGGSSEILALYCGRVDSRAAGGFHGIADEHEDIKVVVLDYRAAMRRLRAGEIVNGPTVLALYWLAANRARLRRRWK
ncbi:MAG TPA: NUDIX domain-containing protein [Stellaceae bacterium]|nr:NUDIX domain-containing protein [Stellaceae bacterium]